MDWDLVIRLDKGFVDTVDLVQNAESFWFLMMSKTGRMLRKIQRGSCETGGVAGLGPSDDQVRQE